MSHAAMPARWSRRARPLLGTLVEIGFQSRCQDDAAVVDAAFATVLDVQRCLSRFDADSDVSRFHALRCGSSMRLRPATVDVLAAARDLQIASHGAFDITLGTAPHGWLCDGDELHKLAAGVRLDLGGIGKGYAVDVAVQALIDDGCLAGWVNAGGDLRAFGEIDLPVHVRDESCGGVRPFAKLREGAFATSHFGAGARAQLVGSADAHPLRTHVSVAAPRCLWADALTKVVAISGDTSHPVLGRYHATAWH